MEQWRILRFVVGERTEKQYGFARWGRTKMTNQTAIVILCAELRFASRLQFTPD